MTEPAERLLDLIADRPELIENPMAKIGGVDARR